MTVKGIIITKSILEVTTSTIQVTVLVGCDPTGGVRNFENWAAPKPNLWPLLPFENFNLGMKKFYEMGAPDVWIQGGKPTHTWEYLFI